MSKESCDEEVFEKGVSVGLYAMTREQAEQFCEDQTKATGFKHDWHYLAGRVHVLALLPEGNKDADV